MLIWRSGGGGLDPACSARDLAGHGVVGEEKNITKMTEREHEGRCGEDDDDEGRRVDRRGRI
jgi:hypothetical protein